LFPRPPEPPPRPPPPADPLKAIAGQFWNQWPARWEYGKAAVLPEHTGQVVNNLVRMRKRITIAQKDRQRIGEILALVKGGKGLPRARQLHIRPQIL
jgi:hypothetical protein